MSQLTVTSYGHSTVRLQDGPSSVVIDPGGFAPGAAFLASAFLVTHDHPDHFDAGRVSSALSQASAGHAWVPGSAARQLAARGVAADQVSVITGSESFTAAGFLVEAIVGEHAEIYSALPPSENIAYLVNGRILHPGDAFPAIDPAISIDVLFLPVSGPWMRFADAADYVTAVRPRVVVPIHDGDLIDEGKALTDQLGGLLPGNPEYRRLEAGHSWPV